MKKLSVIQPNPLPASTHLRRRDDCKFRPGCLTEAAKGDWPSWSCHRCKAFEAEDDTDRSQNVDGLIALGYLLDMEEGAFEAAMKRIRGDRRNNDGTNNRNREKTHCANGHAYTEENTRWSNPHGFKNDKRDCRTCDLARKAQKRRAKGIPERKKRNKTDG